MIISKNLIPSSIYSKQALNTFNTIQLFSSDTLNYRVPLIDPFSNKPTDQYIYRYSNHMFSAYMQKRKLKRSQIWPKIHVLEDPPLNQQPHLKYQKLFQVKRLLDEDLMKRIAREDPTQINSTFIISLFSEDSFKQLIDQYVGKTLVCGKAPSAQSMQKMRQLQTKVMDLYRNFYFGEMITPLQRQIQRFYLAAKQQKSGKRRLDPKNRYLRCRWRQQDQRLIQDFVNWPEADINLSDLSYRPYFERLNISSRLPYVQKYTNLIGGATFLSRWLFEHSIKKQYSYSQGYLRWIKTQAFSRIVQYTKCLQFTQTMKIPPDFMIEMSIMNIHVWLVTDRLRQINTKKTLNLARMLDRMFYQYFDNLIGSLNIKKLSITRRRLQQILAVNKNNLNMHFNGYEKTKNNPYYLIDALVWSVAFRSKTQRYCDEVYKFSEYLIKNRQHFKNYDQQDLLDAVFEFDCFLIDPDYTQKIISINPQMPKQQFQQQFKSNKENKKYYYKTNIENQDYEIQIKQPLKQQQRFSFIGSLISKFAKFYKKYLTNMERYDHYTAMDQQQKMAQIKDKKSPWKSETDRLAQLDSEMGNINQIRRERSRKKDSSNIRSAETPKNTGRKSQQPHKKQ